MSLNQARARWRVDLVLVIGLGITVAAVGVAGGWGHYQWHNLLGTAFLSVAALVLGATAVRLEAGVLTLGAIPVLASVVALDPGGAVVVAVAANAKRSFMHRQTSHLPVFFGTTAWASAGSACHRLVVEAGVPELIGAPTGVVVAVVCNLAVTSALLWALAQAPRRLVLRRTFRSSILSTYLCFSIAGLVCGALLTGSAVSYLEVSAILFLSSFVVRSLDQQRRRELLAEQLATADERAAFGHAMETVLHRLKNLVSVGLANVEEARESGSAYIDRAAIVLSEAAEMLRQVGVEGRGLFNPQPVSCDLRTIVAVACEEITPLARQNRVKLMAATGTGEMHVLVDEALVRDVLVNLLRNGIAHAGAQGEVQVSCDFRPNGWPAVRVQDSGRGVTPSRVGTLFSGRCSDSEGGAGLGLVSSYIIARQHYGTILYEGGPQLGGVFVLVLPPKGLVEQRPTALSERALTRQLWD